MPSFIKKIGNLFKKQETYRPSQAAGAGTDSAAKPKPAAKKADRPNAPHKPRKPRATQPAATTPQTDAPRKPRPPRAPRRRPAADSPKPADAPAKKPARSEPAWDPAAYPVEPKEGKTRFQDLKLPVEILHAIADLNFKYCTPIQAEILPLTLEGKDMAGKAQTGTGKTAAFLLGILTRFMNNKQEAPKPGTPRALILAPTRELAMQIRDDAEKLSAYTPFNTVAIYGGIDYDKQRRMLEVPVDIIVATPGRLIDFASQGVINLREVEVLVIDEADRMLDMGFIPDVRKIIYKTPPKEKRQTLLFSATLDDAVMRLASAWMTDPGKIEIEPDT